MSTGIEPNFAFSYTRKTESLHGEDTFYKVYAPIAQEYILNNNLPEESELPDYYVTAQNLDALSRIKMQGTWQQYIDASISSTVNLPFEATIEDVENIYLDAWKFGLKGVTVYRAGCKREGILTVEQKECKKGEPEKEIKNLEEPSGLKRGEMKKIAGDTIYYPYSLMIGCGKLKIMIGYSRSECCIQDIYVIRSGQGGCEKNIQAIAIYMSGILRLGGDLHMLEKAIKGVSGCTSFAISRAKGQLITQGGTCPSAILNVLKIFEENLKKGLVPEFIQENTPVWTSKDIMSPNEVKITMHKKSHAAVCQECGSELEVSGGCFSCRSCGYSKCE